MRAAELRRGPVHKIIDRCGRENRALVMATSGSPTTPPPNIPIIRRFHYYPEVFVLQLVLHQDLKNPPGAVSGLMRLVMISVAKPVRKPQQLQILNGTL